MIYKKLKLYKPNSNSLFHQNTCSLNKNFDDLEYLVKTTNQTFNVIAISESTIKSNMDITTHINLPISLNTHQQRAMLEEPSYILVIA